MSGIREWAYLICVGVVFCGAMVMLLPQRQLASAAKGAVGLFLAFCILSPFLTGRFSFSLPGEDFREEISQSSLEIAAARDQMVLSQFRQNLRQTLAENLSPYGIKESDILITITNESLSQLDFSIIIRLGEESEPNAGQISSAIKQMTGKTPDFDRSGMGYE